MEPEGLRAGNPTPTESDGLLYLGTGSQGEADRPLFAVRPGASGDISLKTGDTSNAFVAWFQPRAAAYTSSPLVFGGRVYAVNDTGILQVFDARTGREIYKARVGGVGNTFSASPWALGGKIFFLSEEGDTSSSIPAIRPTKWPRTASASSPSPAPPSRATGSSCARRPSCIAFAESRGLRLLLLLE